MPSLDLGHLLALSDAVLSYNRLAPAPVLSMILPDGQRSQFVLPPVIQEGGISINIRKHTSVVRTIDQLAANGAFRSYRDVGLTGDSAPQISDSDHHLLELKNAGRIDEFLRACVAYRRNIVIAGKTGSGKTTFARSLIELVDSDERLITIEDTHELQLPNHPNRVHMLYGSADGRVSATECLASCMRMSPDRIFLAELRGSESWEYLQALNTGHPGSVTTTHANSATGAFSRIAMLIKQTEAGQRMDLDTILAYLYQTLHVVLYFADFQLKELYFDPIHAASAMALA